jgi:hypothetical protein
VLTARGVYILDPPPPRKRISATGKGGGEGYRKNENQKWTKMRQEREGEKINITAVQLMNKKNTEGFNNLFVWQQAKFEVYLGYRVGHVDPDVHGQLVHVGHGAPVFLHVVLQFKYSYNKNNIKR